MKIDDRLIPLRRPHFELRGHQLFFLISARPYLLLSQEETTLWQQCDGRTSVRELASRIPGLREAVTRLWEKEAIELAPESFPEGRKKVVVIEPHMDDAVLSVGGQMWSMRNTHEFTVVTVAGVSNFTSYQKIDRDYLDVETVTALRRRESELVARVLGGHHVALAGHDAPLRYQPGNWTLDWFKRNKRSISAYINHYPGDDEVRRRVAQLLRFLRNAEAEEIWIPMGVGMSADHEATRNACLLALMELSKHGDRRNVSIYQDVPYGVRFPDHALQIPQRLEATGAAVEWCPVDITGAMPEKLRLISIFASQFKMSYMGHRVEENGRAHSPGNSGYGELMVRVNELPETIDLFELYSGAPQVRVLVRKLQRWQMRNHEARRITILSPMGVGRWKDYMELILDRFPKAIIDVYLTEDALDETRRFQSPRIVIHPVAARGSAWMKTLGMALLHFPRPLIVFTGWKLQRVASLLQALSLPLNVLPAASIGHVVEALRRTERSVRRPVGMKWRTPGNMAQPNHSQA